METIDSLEEDTIYPGLVLQKNYVFLHKIGEGNNASVWMVYDINSRKMVAINVQYEHLTDEYRSVTVHKIIQQNCANCHCCTLINYFAVVNDNCTYTCFIYPMLATSLDNIIKNGDVNYGLSINAVKIITKQLLIAVESLHRTNIVHTDIKPANILLAGKTESQMMVEEKFFSRGFLERYDKIKNQKQNESWETKLSNIAAHCVQDLDDICKETSDNSTEESSVESDLLSEPEIKCFNIRRQSVNDIITDLENEDVYDLSDLYNFDQLVEIMGPENSTILNADFITNPVIYLGDFGNSLPLDDLTMHEIQDRRIRAPEVILDLPYSLSCDIWSIMCTVFELLTGDALFEPYDYPANQDQQQIYLFERILGPISKKMKKSSRRCQFLFNPEDDYNLRNVEPGEETSIHDILVQKYNFAAKDANLIQKFLLLGLCYRPEDRMTASDLLLEEWLIVDNQ
jgi:serine/threonine-protein kinase SRPK3